MKLICDGSVTTNQDTIIGRVTIHNIQKHLLNSIINTIILKNIITWRKHNKICWCLIRDLYRLLKSFLVGGR